jgi:putative hydroxymethylpyrimidine transport system substrate-binding protein
VPALLSGKIDAVLGAYWNYEAIQLAQMHKRTNVIRMDQVGVPSYNELVVVVRANTIVNHPDVIRRFVQALARGYESARSDPTVAVQNLVKASPGLDPKLQLASVRATMPVFFPTGSHPWGWQDPSQWNAYGQWMLDHHLISDPEVLVGASTNELLAGQGVG